MRVLVGYPITYGDFASEFVAGRDFIQDDTKLPVVVHTSERDIFEGLPRIVPLPVLESWARTYGRRNTPRRPQEPS